MPMANRQTNKQQAAAQMRILPGKEELMQVVGMDYSTNYSKRQQKKNSLTLRGRTNQYKNNY